jgi:2-(1,2-epoxy-1,2-dihydrophenyl)acetyl-CoA isomerase
MADGQPLLVTDEGDGVIAFTLDAPKQLNPISHALMDAMNAALKDVAQSPQARVLIIRANGKGFSAGGDMATIEKGLTDSNVLATLIDRLHAATLAIHRLPIPVIASVNGAAAGAGFSMAVACDLLVAARSSRFIVAYQKLGTSSDGGLSHFLTRKLGAAKAMELILLRGQLTADEANALGLVTRLADDDKLAEETLALARQIATVPRHAAREFKQLVNGTDDGDLVRQLDREKDAFLRCAKTDEFRERVTAFLAQRRG